MHRSRSRNRASKPITITGSKQFDENGVIPVTCRRTGDIDELRNRYGYNLPPTTNGAGCRVSDTMRSKTHASADFWNNCGSSPPVVRLLFTGRLPLNFFTDICYGRKAATPCKFHYREAVQREKELWEPKGAPGESCRKVMVSVEEARTRHRTRMEQIQQRAQEHQKQVETVLMRQRNIERRGLSCYLKKMEREAERLMRKWKPQKQTRDSAIPLGGSNAGIDVFITASGRRIDRAPDSDSESEF